MHGVLLMTNCSRNYLCIDVIMELLPQTTLHWKGFIKELQVDNITNYSRKLSNISLNHNEFLLLIIIINLYFICLFIKALFRFMNKYDCFPMLVILRSACTPHHLQDICYRKVDISFGLPIIKLCSLHKK